MTSYQNAVVSNATSFTFQTLTDSPSATLARHERFVTLGNVLPVLAKLPQVKCDRDDPCGNCFDQNIRCVRTASAPQKARSASKRPRPTESLPSQKSSRRNELQNSPTPSSHSPNVAQSPSLLEAQDFFRQEITSRKHMPADRRAVLNAAMAFVSQLSQAPKPSDAPTTPNTRVSDVLEGIRYPSTEMLYWMLRGKPCFLLICTTP
jgi:hypothetical protein